MGNTADRDRVCRSWKMKWPIPLLEGLGGGRVTGAGSGVHGWVLAPSYLLAGLCGSRHSSVPRAPSGYKAGDNGVTSLLGS